MLNESTLLASVPEWEDGRMYMQWMRSLFVAVATCICLLATAADAMKGFLFSVGIVSLVTTIDHFGHGNPADRQNDPHSKARSRYKIS